MDEKNLWERFEKSGKVSDYIEYKQMINHATNPVAEAKVNADKDTGNYPQAT